ncbi:hypothetical protein Q8F55_005762 [Vanrija albida]|uniref:F-box domain-containing protein n=1 Tax=Vanrija albida TaxID=181172 RepID=A0ABR3Q3K0_9TREE
MRSRQWPACPPSPPAAASSAAASGSALPIASASTGALAPAAAPTAPAAPPTPHAVAPVTIPSQALSPPTPAPSPTPTERWTYASINDLADDAASIDSVPRLDQDIDVDQRNRGVELLQSFRCLSKAERFAFLNSLIGELQLNEALVVSSKISPRLKRDFLRDLPVELALHCVSFLDDARTLGRAMRVSKYWNDLLQDERLWRDMFNLQLYRPHLPLSQSSQSPPPAAGADTAQPPAATATNLDVPMHTPQRERPFGAVAKIRRPLVQPQTYREQFRNAFLTESNWIKGGRLLTTHASIGDSVVTSLVVNDDYIVIGMANSKIHVFDAASGHFRQSLIGHDLGVWALVLVSPRRADRNRTYDSPQRSSSDTGASRRASFTGATPPTRSTPAFPPTRTASDDHMHYPRQTKRMRSSDVCGSAAGWGAKATLVVSGGCDRDVRVWNIVTGECIHKLRGHSSTIRCLKVLDGRPIAVSGSRDFTLRVWDIDRGRMLRVLEGHEQSVRCIEVAGNQVVSGSYDYTCRLWDIDTGECLQVFEGHYHQIYAVAFDGERVVSGSLDSTVRVWDAGSGECLAILQGHTSLVGQLQLSGDRLITGGSDGRVIVFDLTDNSCVHRLCAHDNSVTCLQFDDRFIVSGGNDGRVKLWDIQTGTLIRELTRPCEAVWRVCFRDDKCAILCQRNGKTVLEVIGFRPEDELPAPAPLSRTPDW